MSSMPSGSRRLAGLLGPSWDVLVSPGTSLPQSFPKVYVVIFDPGTEAICFRIELEEQSLGAVLQELSLQHQAVQVYGDQCRYPDLPHRPLPAGASPLVIPLAADDLISKKSEMFYGAVSMELHSILSSHMPLPRQKHAGVDGD